MDGGDNILRFPARAREVLTRVRPREIQALETRLKCKIQKADRPIFARNLGKLIEQFGDRHDGVLNLIKKVAGGNLKRRSRYIRLAHEPLYGEFGADGPTFVGMVKNLARAEGAGEDVLLYFLRQLLASTSMAPNAASPAIDPLRERESALRDLQSVAAKIARDAQLSAYFERLRNLPVEFDSEAHENGEGLPIRFRGERPEFSLACADSAETFLVPSVHIGTVYVPVAVLSVDLPATHPDAKFYADKRAEVMALIESRFGRPPSHGWDDMDAGGPPTEVDPWSAQEWDCDEWVEGDSTDFWTTPAVEDWGGTNPEAGGRAWRRLYLQTNLELTLQPVDDTVSFGFRLRRSYGSNATAGIAETDFDQTATEAGIALFSRSERLFVWRPAHADLMFAEAERTLLESASVPIGDRITHDLLFGVLGNCQDEGLADDWDTIREGRRVLELRDVCTSTSMLGPVASDTLAGQLLAHFASSDGEECLAARLTLSARDLIASVDAKFESARSEYGAAMRARWGDQNGG